LSAAFENLLKRQFKLDLNVIFFYIVVLVFDFGDFYGFFISSGVYNSILKEVAFLGISNQVEHLYPSLSTHAK